MKLKGKVALITGAGSGMGRAMALLFAEEGAAVAVIDINLPSAEKTTEAINQNGHKAIAIKANVAEASEVDAMIKTVIRELGGINILVNNAGVSSGGPTIDFPLKTWKKIIDVNLKGPFLCSQAAGRWMIQNGGGRIINIASTAGIIGIGGAPAYCSSKAGIINLTHALAAEWAKDNILVNAIAPGYIMTPMQEEVLRSGPFTKEGLEKSIPVGKLGEPEDVAKAALFLASDDSAYITGITLPVDGGYICCNY